MHDILSMFGKYLLKQHKLISDQDSLFTTNYLIFSRQQWSTLRDSAHMKLSKYEITRLKSVNKDLSLEEIIEIYLPLSLLLNFYINSNLRHQTVCKKSLGNTKQKIPYIIGITGSVAVGKSTTARVLQTLLSCWPEHRHVELITTDGFLHPNVVLKERGLMKKKGFPESYDMHRLINFITDLKFGAVEVTAPVYSHLIYDIVPNDNKVIQQPDILIIEGLNVLQNKINYLHNHHHIFVSDFVDFSIYVDAPENLLERWYINRFLKLRDVAFTDPNSYFYNFAKIGKKETVNIATKLWREINWLNLKENILPTRENARLILSKTANHVVEKVRLRK